MNPNITMSTDDDISDVFVGPVTQRELILTWKKRRQLKLEQEREQAEIHNVLEPTDRDQPSNLCAPTSEIRENDCCPSIAKASPPSADPNVNSPFPNSNAIEMAQIRRVPDYSESTEEELVSGMNVEVAPSVPEAPSPEKNRYSFHPKDSPSSLRANAKYNDGSPECVNDGGEVPDEPIFSSTVSPENLVHGKQMNSSSPMLDMETHAPARLANVCSADNSRGTAVSVFEGDNHSSSSQFEDAPEEFVITVSDKDGSQTQVIEVLPVASIEKLLDVTLDAGEFSGIADRLEMSNIVRGGAGRGEKPSHRKSGPDPPLPTSDVSSVSLGSSDILLAGTETPLCEQDHLIAELTSSAIAACESNIGCASNMADHLAKEFTDQLEEHVSRPLVEPLSPLLLPPVEPKAVSPTTVESFDDSPIESASIPTARNILRPSKLIVPSSFEGGWGKKLKLMPSKKPKRPAYVQPLNDHEL